MGAFTRDATVRVTTGGGGGGRHARRRSKSRRRHLRCVGVWSPRPDDPQPEDGSSSPQYVCLIAIEGFVSFGFIIVFLCIFMSHKFVNGLYMRFGKRSPFLDGLDGWLSRVAASLWFGSLCRFV